MPSVELPANFQPFPTLIVCGNEFIDGKVVIDVDSRPVLLVGKGNPARVWLQCPMESPQGKSWEWIIRENEKVRKGSDLFVSTPSTSMGIYVDEHTLIHLTVPIPDKKAEIIFLDLKPLGLDIHGDMRGLWVEGNRLFGNYLENAGTMVGLP